MNVRPGRLHLSLRADPSSVPAARRALDEFAGEARLGEGDVYNLRLLATELLANAITHGAGPGDEIELRLDVSAARVRCSVLDPSRTASVPQVLAAAADRGSGRGLYLVESLADRWGDRIIDGRNEVWFEIGLRERTRSSDRSAGSRTGGMHGH